MWVNYCFSLVFVLASTELGTFLITSDFENALEGFTPAALRGVTLHTAGELGWTDVGGLTAVKDALMETLLWPTKVVDKLFWHWIDMKMNCFSCSIVGVGVEESIHEEKYFRCALFPLPLEIPSTIKTRFKQVVLLPRL